jgi:glycosyltransferase involved in cell wall biosynthesis
VVIPCFNDGPFVADAVRSIDEDEPVEVVVIDDGSSDPQTIEVLRKLESDSVSVIRQSNRGVSAARMTGVNATAAPYVFPLDADDQAIPGAIAKMADRLDAAPDADLCFGDYEEFGSHELVRAVPDTFDAYRLSYTNEYPVSSLVRRSALEDAGGWKLREYYEDWDLLMALAERGSHGIHLGPGELTYRHRVHPGRRREALWSNHRDAYRVLRSRHPALFERRAENRRASDMPSVRKALYPIVYGSRPRWSVEPRVKAMLDRMGVWTLRR